MLKTGAQICAETGDHVVRGTLYFAQSKPFNSDGVPQPWAVEEPCERCDKMLVTYKYGSPKECMRKGKEHVIRPDVWPPKRRPSDPEGHEPTSATQCINCGCWCVVSDSTHDGVFIEKPGVVPPVDKKR